MEQGSGAWAVAVSCGIGRKAVVCSSAVLNIGGMRLVMKGMLVFVYL